MAYHFLLVDDEEDFVELLTETIEDEFDCNIDATTQPVEALELTQEQKYDIILIDYLMPVMNGSALLKSLRDKPGINQNTPVILISAYLENVEDEIKQLKNSNFFDKTTYVTNLVPFMNMVLSENE